MSGDRLREVCAELVEALDAELDLFETRHSDLIDRARALLAEAEIQPEVRSFNQDDFNYQCFVEDYR
jgi:hypothetical protein